MTDTGNLHGAVEFVKAAQSAGVKPIVAAELQLDGKPLLLYVINTRLAVETYPRDVQATTALFEFRPPVAGANGDQIRKERPSFG